MNVSSRSRVFICAPTYREPGKIASFLESMQFINYRPLTVIIANASPGDETEQLIARNGDSVDFDLRQVDGVNSEFWSGTINRALRVARTEAGYGDWVVMMNVDIVFNTDIIEGLIHSANLLGISQVGALCHAAGRVISSGVKVQSWALGLNRHPMAGFPLSEVQSGYFQEVDFLPARCVLFPAAFLHQVGLVSEKMLPHYGADNEYTHKLIAQGCRAYVVGDVRVECDVENTGVSVYSARKTLRKRIEQSMSIRNSSNVLYRMRYLRLTYPWWALPTAMLSYLARSLLEIGLGGTRIRRIFSRNERGFS
ncbi:glycosyltransferase [bacterium]|nr:glycosyltransferase [bacterium]